MGSDHIYSLTPYPASPQQPPPPSLKFVFHSRFSPLYDPLSPAMVAGMHKAVQPVHCSKGHDNDWQKTES